MKSSNKKFPPKVIGTHPKIQTTKALHLVSVVPILDRKSSYVKVKSKSE